MILQKTLDIFNGDKGVKIGLVLYFLFIAVAILFGK